MTAKRKPIAPISYEPPCGGCGRMHRLDECDTEDAARILDEGGAVMTAVKVRARAAAKGGAA